MQRSFIAFSICLPMTVVLPIRLIQSNCNRLTEFCWGGSIIWRDLKLIEQERMERKGMLAISALFIRATGVDLCFSLGPN